MSVKTNTYIFIAMALLAPLHSAWAQPAYPTRPIRVVVPYTPGGITDVVTRIVAQEVSKAVGQNVLVDNRPGANSILGVDIVSKATPDGYTLASVIAAHAANQSLYPKLPYDSVKSFAPVSLLVTAPLIVTATNNLAAKDAKDLVALAKAKPGSISEQNFSGPSRLRHRRGGASDHRTADADHRHQIEPRAVQRHGTCHAGAGQQRNTNPHGYTLIDDAARTRRAHQGVGHGV